MTEVVNVKKIISFIEELAPKSLAMEGDKIGLQVGSFNQTVNKVMVTLDVLESVVDEAIENNVDLIISHHALIYSSLKVINTNQEKGRIIEKLIKNNISVYVAHTNLDMAEGGVNDFLMSALNIKNKGILLERCNEQLLKLVVFVPESHANEVRDAICENGAGHIGNYSDCTFQSNGVGTFKPLEDTNPYIGKTGKIEKVDEIRIETVVPKYKLSKVLKAMEEAHPYEEVAYDLFPLELKGKSFGLGRIGCLDKPMTLKDFAEHVKDAFNVPALRVVGDLSKKVKTIGVIGGDGGSFISEVKQRGCDVLITGDLYYHTAHDALGIGLNVIDPGHNIEKVMKEGIKQYLEDCFKKYDLDVMVFSSNTNTEPFQFV